MKDVHLKDLKEFLTWAMKQNAKTRFKLNDRYSSLDREQQYDYSLEVAGTGGQFRPMMAIHIPQEVGKPLAEVWKENQYGRYVGLRNIKSILKIVKVSDAIIAKYEATRLAVEAEQKRHRMGNNADYALERLESVKREISSINKTLDGLGLHDSNLVILRHDALKLRLVELVNLGEIK